MKKGNCAGLCGLVVLVLFLAACVPRAAHREQFMDDRTDDYTIALRQPGKDLKALAESLKEKALLRCEAARFHKVWIRALRVWYSPKINETIGGVVFHCQGRKSQLW